MFPPSTSGINSTLFLFLLNHFIMPSITSAKDLIREREETRREMLEELSRKQPSDNRAFTIDEDLAAATAKAAKDQEAFDKKYTDFLQRQKERVQELKQKEAEEAETKTLMREALSKQAKDVTYNVNVPLILLVIIIAMHPFVLLIPVVVFILGFVVTALANMRYK